LVEGDGPSDAYRLPEVAGIAVTPGLADGAKCERCWRVLPEVAVDEPICERCTDAVSTTLDAAE
jgi:isoleucyl-tRNA synthetase